MPVRRSDDTTYTLGTGLSASGDPVAIKGGQYIFLVDGTVGGATVSLQVEMPNNTFTDILGDGVAVKSTALPYGHTSIDLPACRVKVALTGGTPSGVNAYLAGLG